MKEPNYYFKLFAKRLGYGACLDHHCFSLFTVREDDLLSSCLIEN